MDRWTHRLSEYADGEMPPAEAGELEAHLEGCAACSGVLSELRAVKERAADMPPREPEQDLWPGILEGIRGEALRVIDLDSRRRTREAPATDRRGRRFTVPQLVAAAVALMFLSGSGAWMARDRLDHVRAPGAAAETFPGNAPATFAASPAAGAPGSELSELARILEEHRDRLAPNTVRILEKNLAAIDRAIAESRAALEVDPGNAFLEAYLEGSLRRKEEFLREARALIAAD